MGQNWLNILGMWSWEPSILIGTGVFISAYLLAVGPMRKRITSVGSIKRGQIVWFGLGTLVILFALISPLDPLGDEYLFSAHMIQHMLLAMIAPPLLLFGTPGWLVEAIIRRTPVRRTALFLTRPATAFLLFNIIYLGWHIPVLYEAALNNETIHIFEHLLFMMTGVINWWPILSPTPELPRLSYPGQALYLFLEAVPCTILGAIISFAPTVMYPTYAVAARILPLNPMDDQQIAGLVMAMPAGMIYLVAFSVVFLKWLESENRPSALQQDPKTHS